MGGRKGCDVFGGIERRGVGIGRQSIDPSRVMLGQRGWSNGEICKLTLYLSISKLGEVARSPAALVVNVGSE